MNKLIKVGLIAFSLPLLGLSAGHANKNDRQIKEKRLQHVIGLEQYKICGSKSIPESLKCYKLSEAMMRNDCKGKVYSQNVCPGKLKKLRKKLKKEPVVTVVKHNVTHIQHVRKKEDNF